MLLKYALEYLQSSTYHWYRGKVTFRIENFAHFGICNFGAAGLSARGRAAYRMIGARGRSHALQRHLILILFATKGNTHESAKKTFWLTNSPIIHIRNMLLFFRLKCRLISWSRASLSAIIFFYFIEKQIYPALTPNEHYQESAPSMMIKFIFISFFRQKHTTSKTEKKLTIRNT